MPGVMTTPGRLLVNSVLPPEFHTDEVLGKSEADALLARIAMANPDSYREISHKLMMLGANAAYDEGTTLRLSDAVSPIDIAPYLETLAVQTKKIAANPKMTKEEKAQAMEGVFSTIQGEVTAKTFEAALAKGNPFALQVKSKARGNPAQLSALMSSPGVYEDASGRTIPLFVSRSYASGLRPSEYWASTYGARKSVISTKFATRDAGDLGKQFGTSAARLLVTEKDCGAAGGLPVPAGDIDNIGSVLASDVGEFKAGTPITRPMLSALRKDRDEVVVRSPVTCAAKFGICSQCAGLREGGKFADVGAHVGYNASSAVAERIAQGSLNTKHSGGIAGAKGEATYAGFPVVEQLAQIPTAFPHAAPLATEAGRVDEIRPAPQGGVNVMIGGVAHYAPVGRAIYVKPGDQVDPGDQLASGIINPAEIVKYKGLGEGRRYLTQRMTQALKESGYDANRRNVEVLSRGMVDHVFSDSVEDDDTAMPGDVLSYNSLAYMYKPRKDAIVGKPTDALGQYLEQPALHYTIGTPITKSVVDRLQKHNINAVMSHKQRPGFHEEMLSLREIPQHEKDWVAQLGSSYLQAGLLKNVHRGATSNSHGLHPVPAIAKGTEIGDVPKGTAGY